MLAEVTFCRTITLTFYAGGGLAEAYEELQAMVRGEGP